MSPMHKQACKTWAEQKAATTAEAGYATSSALAEPEEEQAVEAEEDVACLPVKELKGRLDHLT
jgi:hypothetical protein